MDDTTGETWGIFCFVLFFFLLVYVCVCVCVYVCARVRAFMFDYAAHPSLLPLLDLAATLFTCETPEVFCGHQHDLKQMIIIFVNYTFKCFRFTLLLLSIPLHFNDKYCTFSSLHLINAFSFSVDSMQNWSQIQRQKLRFG